VEQIMKWLFPEEKVCPSCGNHFIPSTWQQKYCSHGCYLSAKRERQMIREHERYRSDSSFRFKAKQAGQDSRRRFLDFWHEGADGNRIKGYNTRLQAQVFIAKKLEDLGYSDILDTIGIIYTSPIDIFAKKEGKVHGFLVTTRGQQTSVSKAAVTLAKYFNLEQLYVAWVKPDLSWWKLFPVDFTPTNLYLRQKELGDEYKLWCLRKNYPIKSREIGGLIRCWKCKMYKEPNQFNLRSGGLEYACIPCEKEYGREWARKSYQRRKGGLQSEG
jgi:hypothetical protein